jgi:hypothetical protein
MNKIIVFAAIILSGNVFGQSETVKKESSATNPWKIKSNFGLNMTQSTFTNWAAGGRNNIAGSFLINSSANYSKDKIKWANQLALGLGGIQYFDQGLEKTDDVIDFQSTLSYGFKKPWFVAGIVGFRTQFLDGFANPEDSIRASTFLAPGYGNTTIGIEYQPNDNFKLMASPISGKYTIVQDETLSNQGAFGVEGATFDNNGNIITPGSQFRAELGSYIRLIFNKEIMKNIDLSTRWEFFSNYLENPENIDVNAELIMNFKVNEWFSASLQANLIYDDDILITDRNGNVGPRTQFKQVIGLGVSYRIANFEKEE